MEKFDINILGCGSALPTTRHLPTSQIINFRDNLFMIDCGEGTQLQMRKMHLKFSRLNHLFISHLHGDHCFGFIGMVSTLGLLGRTGEFFVHAHPDAEKIFRPQLDYFCKELPFKITFVPFTSSRAEVVYEDRSLIVRTVPLKHRVPSVGFVFEEKEKLRHLKPEMIRFWNIPIKALQGIKEGADWITADGDRVPNKALTIPASPSRKYAYCSDTAYSAKIIPFIEGVDLLYHEATFTDEALPRARATQHSTARQAAQIAQQADVKKLMLGHFSARYQDDNVLLDEARAVFPDTILANEELVYSL